ncbi:MAG: TonB-dependent receptor [Mangrovibacterium sp.]
MRTIWICLVCFLCATLCQAKDGNVMHGRVYAFDNIALQNISVTAKKSGEVVKTDSLGNFAINVGKKDRLSIEGHGFNSESVRIFEDDNMNVKLIFKGGDENERIAVSNGYLTEEQLLYAIKHLSNYNNKYSTYTDIFRLIEGEFRGIEVKDNGVYVDRTQDQSVGGSTEALYVVDDIIVTTIENINPIDVKSITILKDGSTAAYGYRGANGVVVIKTY